MGLIGINHFCIVLLINVFSGIDIVRLALANPILAARIPVVFRVKTQTEIDPKKQLEATVIKEALKRVLNPSPIEHADIESMFRQSGFIGDIAVQIDEDTPDDPPDFPTTMEARAETWEQSSGVRLTPYQSTYFKSFGQNMGRRSQCGTTQKIRKEIRQLDASERSVFIRALHTMRTAMIDGMSEYDIFVAHHTKQTAPAAHYGAAFLPWHREYLLRFECALRLHEPTVALPYWDSSLDSKIPQSKDSILWTPAVLGNAEGSVSLRSIPWKIADSCGSGDLEREVGHHGDDDYLFDDSKVQEVLNKKTFTEITHIPPKKKLFSKFEEDHGRVHVFVGGEMYGTRCSPNDPLFWMHHAFIDCIWEDFRQNSQNKTKRETEYPTTSANGNIGGKHHEPTSPMHPFEGFKNIDGLSDNYTNIYYKCSPRPNDCTSNSDCGHYLWCDSNDGKCKSKIKVGGDCTGFVGFDPCEQDSYACINDVCVHSRWHTILTNVKVYDTSYKDTIPMDG